jgi:hypothetical protein
VADQDGRPAWSTTLPVVLEKHGLPAVDVASPEVLEQPSVLRDFGAVLVARLPINIDVLFEALAQLPRERGGGTVAV